jgi:glycosyltransferase involved in cell wall biosynthesis
MRIIPNGVDLERFRPPVPGERESLRAEFELPAAEPVFVYSGKLNRGKGLPVLLEAWKDYAVRGGRGVLVLVGAGGGQFLSAEEELRRTAAAEGFGGRVRFAGYRQDVERWLRAADVFVFPSESESFGLAPLEANATGLPAICTDAGALAETVPDGVAGIRVPVGDAGAIRRAMEELAASPERRERIGRTARARVETE